MQALLTLISDGHEAWSDQMQKGVLWSPISSLQRSCCREQPPVLKTYMLLTAACDVLDTAAADICMRAWKKFKDPCHCHKSAMSGRLDHQTNHWRHCCHLSRKEGLRLCVNIYAIWP